MKETLWVLLGMVGVVVALFAVCLLVAFVVGLIQLWRRDGFLTFASKLGWISMLAGTVVCIVAMSVVGVSLLIDADQVVDVGRQVAGWSFVVGFLGLPCLLQAQLQLCKRRAVE